MTTETETPLAPSAALVQSRPDWMIRTDNPADIARLDAEEGPVVAVGRLFPIHPSSGYNPHQIKAYLNSLNFLITIKQMNIPPLADAAERSFKVCGWYDVANEARNGKPRQEFEQKMLTYLQEGDTNALEQGRQQLVRHLSSLTAIFAAVADTRGILANVQLIDTHFRNTNFYPLDNPGLTMQMNLLGRQGQFADPENFDPYVLNRTLRNGESIWEDTRCLYEHAFGLPTRTYTAWIGANDKTPLLYGDHSQPNRSGPRMVYTLTLSEQGSYRALSSTQPKGGLLQRFLNR